VFKNYIEISNTAMEILELCGFNEKLNPKPNRMNIFEFNNNIVSLRDLEFIHFEFKSFLDININLSNNK
jgi:hypothetical protein